MDHYWLTTIISISAHLINRWHHKSHPHLKKSKWKRFQIEKGPFEISKMYNCELRTRTHKNIAISCITRTCTHAHTHALSVNDFRTYSFWEFKGHLNLFNSFFHEICRFSWVIRSSWSRRTLSNIRRRTIKKISWIYSPICVSWAVICTTFIKFLYMLTYR